MGICYPRGQDREGSDIVYLLIRMHRKEKEKGEQLKRFALYFLEKHDRCCYCYYCCRVVVIVLLLLLLCLQIGTSRIAACPSSWTAQRLATPTWTWT